MLTRTISQPLSSLPRLPIRLFSSTPLSLSSNPTPASYAYAHPPSPASAGPSRPPAPPPPSRATTEAPLLSPEDKELVDRIIRVDQAGELGANWIYRGQKAAMALRGDWKAVKQIEEMWDNERHHLNVMSHLQKQHRTRPTLLYPLWQAMAFGLGAGTGLMGREAAMACTEAVETVIGEHYDDQIRALQPLLSSITTPTTASTGISSETGTQPHPSLPLLRDIITEFRDDELEHLDTAVEEGAQRAPGHALLGAVIGWGCKAAIKICERV